MSAYYNEHDPQKAAWLRELIKRGLVADGEVDERSVEDVLPAELVGYSQCHFFAGIGVWSYALRLAGWPDERPVWTGSCPCQPFSAAGKREGFADERHLWPAWGWLIKQCRPDVVFGEQVAGEDGLTWLDLVQADLEAGGYAVGPLVIPAAGVGAPHGRHRIYFVADSERDAAKQRRSAIISGEGYGETAAGAPTQSGRRSLPCGMDNAIWPGLEGQSRPDGDSRGRTEQTGSVAETGPTNGFWRDAIWLPCRDGKMRCTKPGIEPLVARSAARVVRLRGYGDSIVAQVAEEFIKAYMNAMAPRQVREQEDRS